jgi:hypothetical protein
MHNLIPPVAIALGLLAAVRPAQAADVRVMVLMDQRKPTPFTYTTDIHGAEADRFVSPAIVDFKPYAKLARQALAHELGYDRTSYGPNTDQLVREYKILEVRSVDLYTGRVYFSSQDPSAHTVRGVTPAAVAATAAAAGFRPPRGATLEDAAVPPRHSATTSGSPSNSSGTHQAHSDPGAGHSHFADTNPGAGHSHFADTNGDGQSGRWRRRRGADAGGANSNSGTVSYQAGSSSSDGAGTNANGERRRRNRNRNGNGNSNRPRGRGRGARRAGAEGGD